MYIRKGRAAQAVRLDEMHHSFVELQTEGPLYVNPFIDSLDEMTPDDIAPPVKKAKLSMGDRIFNIVRYLIINACALVFVGCMVYIVYNLYQYKAARDYYNNIAEGLFDEVNIEPDNYFATVSKLSQSAKSTNLYNYETFLKKLGSGIPAVSIIDGTHNLQYERIKAKLAELHAENNDIYGWIKVDNTRINYPLVQGADNTYYLDHTPSGDFLKAGSIFVDYRNGPSLAENMNTVIYGHNQADNTMFSNIDKFIRSESFFNETKITIYTFDGIYTYEPFSVSRVKAYYPYFRTHFTSTEDFLAFAEDMHSRSIWKKDVTITENDRLITLSTCDNITTDGRYSVHARLISIEK